MERNKGGQGEDDRQVANSNTQIAHRRKRPNFSSTNSSLAVVGDTCKTLVQEDDVVDLNLELEKENRILKHRIAALQGELTFLTNSSKQSKFAIWKEQVLNESLKAQLQDFRILRSSMLRFFSSSMGDFDKSEVLHHARLNAAFLISRIHLLLKQTRSIPPSLEEPRKLYKKKHLFREALRVAVRQFCLRNGPHEFNVDDHDVESWRPDIDLHLLGATLSTVQISRHEKYVRINIKNLPISKNHFELVARKLDIFALILAAGQIIAGNFKENEADGVPTPPVGGSDSYVPLDILPEDEDVYNLDLRFIRPSGEHENTKMFFSTAYRSSNPHHESIFVHSAITSFDEEIKATDSRGMLFTRGVTIKQGRSEQFSDVTMIIGLKKLFELMSDEDKKRFSQALGVLGGEHFMRNSQHSVEHVLNFMEAVFKCSFYVCNFLLGWDQNTVID